MKKFQFLIEQYNDTQQDTKYREGIMKHFISSYIYFNDKLQPLIDKLDEFMQMNVQNTKLIKKFFNYTIRKNDDNFN